MKKILKYILICCVFAAFVGQSTYAQKLNEKQDDKKEKEEDQKRNVEVEALFIIASKYKITGDQKSAEKAYLNVLSKDEENHAAMYELARLKYETNDFTEAIDHAENACKLDNENKWYKVLLAELYNSNSDYDKAAKVYGELTKKHPYNATYWQDYAYMLTKANKNNEALKALNYIEANFGIDESIARQKQQIYLNKGETDKAIEEIENLIYLNPTKIKYYNLLADMYSDLKQEQKVIQTYNRLIKVDPNNPYAFLALAEIYKSKGNIKKFNELINKAFSNPRLDVNSKIAFLLPYIDLVSENNESGDQKLAFKLLNQLNKAYPQNAKVKAMYGDFYAKINDKKTALKAYDQATKIDPNSFLVWQQILFMHSESSNYDALILNSKKVISIFPNQPLAYFFNGFANIKKKNYKAAIKSLKQGALMGSANKSLQVQTYNQLGEAYNSIKDYKNSDKAFESALKINPLNAGSLNNYSYFLSVRGDKLELAEELAVKANKIEPDNPSYQDTFGWVLYKLRKYTEAKEWLMKAYNNGGSENATILEHLGDVFFRLDQKGKALNYWKQALQKDNIEDKARLNKKIQLKKLIEN